MQRDVTVREVMDDAFVGVSESDGVLDTVELLVSEGAPVAVVLHGSDVVGACADRDVLRLLIGDEDPAAATVGEVMTEAVPTIMPDRSLAEARDRMTTRGTRWLVVSDGDEALGIVTERDVLAGSTLGSETAAETTEAGEETVAIAESTATGTAAGAANETAAEDAFEDQGICEVCGALTHDLAAFNGQLLCADCRNV